MLGLDIRCDSFHDFEKRFGLRETSVDRVNIHLYFINILKKRCKHRRMAIKHFNIYGFILEEELQHRFFWNFRLYLLQTL